MLNYLQDGDTIPVVAPYAVASGAGIKVGALFGIAAGAALAGTQVEMNREGVYLLPAVTADVCAPGTKLYWDDAAKLLTVTATGNTLVGAATSTKFAGVGYVSALLDGVIR